MTRAWPPANDAVSPTRAWPPMRASSASARAANRLLLANHTLVTGGAQVQAVSQASNGWNVQLQTPAGAAQLPHSGASCWTRGVILDQTGVALDPWNPALDHIRWLILERTLPTVANPSLLRIGAFVCNFADPSNASCTEGWGHFIDYSAVDTRQVGAMRISAPGTWVSSLGTGNVQTGGVAGSVADGGLAVVRNVTSVGTDHFGDNVAPQGNNFTVIPAADAVQGATQQRTLGVPVTWYTGVMVGWSIVGGTTGAAVTFDPMYWIMDRPGRG